MFVPPQTKETPTYEKYDQLLHGSSRSRSDQILSMEFMRKYIHLAKCLKPKLTEQACEAISVEYSRLRSLDMEDSNTARTQPVTARSLETLIRLSTAHAKARMASKVTVADAHAAIELVQFAYFKKVLAKDKRKRRRSGASSDEDESTVATDETGSTTVVDQSTRKSKRTRTEISMDDESDDEFATPIDAGDLTQRATRRSLAATQREAAAAASAEEAMAIDETITAERLKVFQHRVQAAFRKVREQSLPLVKLMEVVNEGADEPFSVGESRAAIVQMTDANKLMLADDIVFLI